MNKIDRKNETAPSPADQLRAIRESAAVGAAAPSLTRFFAGGSDAEDYLHRRLTNTVTGLAPGHGLHALLLGGDGRMQADLLVYRTGNEFEILVQEDLLAEAFDLLGKYIIVEDVELTRAPKGETSIEIAGPKAARVLARALGGGEAGMEAPWGCATGEETEPPEIAGSPVAWFADGRYATARFHVFCPAEKAELVFSALLAEAKKVGGTSCEAGTWEFERIANGVTRYGVETSPKTIPLNAALWDAVDFDKGCFPGQEMLARIHNLGQPARRLLALEIGAEANLEPGALVYKAGERESDPIGKVLSASTLSAGLPSGTGQTVALCEVAWKHWKGGGGEALFQVDTDQGRVRARARAVRPETEPEFSGN